MAFDSTGTLSRQTFLTEFKNVIEKLATDARVVRKGSNPKEESGEFLNVAVSFLDKLDAANRKLADFHARFEYGQINGRQYTDLFQKVDEALSPDYFEMKTALEEHNRKYGVNRKLHHKIVQTKVGYQFTLDYAEVEQREREILERRNITNTAKTIEGKLKDVNNRLGKLTGETLDETITDTTRLVRDTANKVEALTEKINRLTEKEAAQRKHQKLVNETKKSQQRTEEIQESTAEKLEKMLQSTYP